MKTKKEINVEQKYIDIVNDKNPLNFTKNKMDFQEAVAWITGEKSMANIIPQAPLETWEVRIAVADSAMVSQAYWFLRASKEGLLDQE